MGPASHSLPFQPVTRKGDTRVGSIGLDPTCMSSFLSLSAFIIIIFSFPLKILFIIDFNNKVVCSKVGP